MAPPELDGAARPPSPRTALYVQATSEVGGSDIALYRLVTNLDPTRYRPVVVLPRSGPLEPKLAAAGVRVLSLPMVQLRSIRSVGYQARYLAGFWPTVIRLARLIRRERAVLVHTNSWYALHGPLAALLARVPNFWHIREIPDLPGPARSLLTRMALRLSARVIPMTNGVAGQFGPDGERESKVVSIPDGIDLTSFHPSARGDRIRVALGLRGETPLVGFVARLDPWKGADIFVRAAAIVSQQRPDAHFIVCAGELLGYEAYAREVERLADELGLAGRLHFTGWTFRLDDIPEVMAALDVFVHTSIRPEPFGLVLVEAMATSKPVVAADGGGVPEVVEHGVTGLLVQPGNAAGVAAAVLELLADPAAALRMGQAGRERAEQLFDVRMYAQRMQALYDSVLDPAEMQPT